MKYFLPVVCLKPQTFMCHNLWFLHFQAHKCDNLADEAWDVIRENFESVADSGEFRELTVENLVDIIKYDDLQAAEEEVRVQLPT